MYRKRAAFSASTQCCGKPTLPSPAAHLLVRPPLTSLFPQLPKEAEGWVVVAAGSPQSMYVPQAVEGVVRATVTVHVEPKVVFGYV